MIEGVRLEGIHHVTAITADAPQNVDFYAGLLGLRLVKKTVNQDEPQDLSYPIRIRPGSTTP
jgi:glyoxalase family protein